MFSTLTLSVPALLRCSDRVQRGRVTARTSGGSTQGWVRHAQNRSTAFRLSSVPRIRQAAARNTSRPAGAWLAYCTALIADAKNMHMCALCPACALVSLLHVRAPATAARAETVPRAAVCAMRGLLCSVRSSSHRPLIDSGVLVCR